MTHERRKSPGFLNAMLREFFTNRACPLIRNLAGINKGTHTHIHAHSISQSTIPIEMPTELENARVSSSTCLLSPLKASTMSMSGIILRHISQLHRSSFVLTSAPPACSPLNRSTRVYYVRHVGNTICTWNLGLREPRNGGGKTVHMKAFKVGKRANAY